MRHVDVEPVLRPVLPRVPRRAIRRDPHATVERRRPHVVRPVAAPVPSPDYRGNGAYPVVRPDGGLLVFFSVYGSIDPSDRLDPAGPVARRRRDVRDVPARRIASHGGHCRRASAAVRLRGRRRGRHGLRDVGRLPVQPRVHGEQHRPREVAGRRRLDTAAKRARSGRPRPPSTGSSLRSLSIPRRVPGRAWRSSPTRHAGARLPGCQVVDALLVRSGDGGTTWRAPRPAERRVDTARLGRRHRSRSDAGGLRLHVVRRWTPGAGALARHRARGRRAPAVDLRDDAGALTRLPSKA